MCCEYAVIWQSAVSALEMPNTDLRTMKIDRLNSAKFCVGGWLLATLTIILWGRSVFHSSWSSCQWRLNLRNSGLPCPARGHRIHSLLDESWTRDNPALSTCWLKAQQDINMQFPAGYGHAHLSLPTNPVLLWGWAKIWRIFFHTILNPVFDLNRLSQNITFEGSGKMDKYI